MIVLNEKQYAENCLNKHKMPNEKPYFDLLIVAKYLYKYNGLSGKVLEDSLVEYFKKSNPKEYHTNLMYWDEKIAQIARKAKTIPLYEDEGIWISKKELNTIEKLDDINLKMTAFTILCLAKLGNVRNANNNGWANYNWNDIYTLANVKLSKEKRALFIHELYVQHLIGFANRVDNLNLQVLFIDSDTTTFATNRGDVFVDDFRDLGYYYRMICGDCFTRCLDCGRVIPNNKNRTRKYCNDCSKYVPKQHKQVTCIDCGKTFTVSSKNAKSKRCPECAKEWRRIYMRDRYTPKVSKQ